MMVISAPGDADINPRLVEGVDDKPAALLKARYSLGCWPCHGVEIRLSGEAAPNIMEYVHQT